MKRKTEYCCPVAVRKKSKKFQQQRERKKFDYCCSRFKESVEEVKFVYAYTGNKNIDETEWFMPEWLHIYYCPFCGTYIKGKGFGKPPKRIKRKR